MTKEYKILFTIGPFKWDLIAYRINIISARKRIVDTNVVNDVTSTRHNNDDVGFLVVFKIYQANL